MRAPLRHHRREWGVLMWLARQPGLQPSQLADLLELDRARISRAIASMQAKGLLHKFTETGNGAAQRCN
ncbi:MarR family transcriptional regulator [Comamonas sp. JC664]